MGHSYHAAKETAGQGVQQAKELASQYLRFAFILFPTSYLLSLSLSHRSSNHVLHSKTMTSAGNSARDAAPKNPHRDQTVWI